MSSRSRNGEDGEAVGGDGRAWVDRNVMRDGGVARRCRRTRGVVVAVVGARGPRPLTPVGRLRSGQPRALTQGCAAAAPSRRVPSAVRSWRISSAACRGDRSSSASGISSVYAVRRVDVIRLIELRVQGLLGRFDHAVVFPEDWEFVILHGPNGVGKTRLLELVTAIGSGRLHELFAMPFDSVNLDFNDGAAVRITRSGELVVDEVGDEEDATRLEIELRRPGASEPLRFPVAREQWRPPEPMLRSLERRLPLERVDRDTWYDHSHEDYVSFAELATRYPGSLGPPSARAEDIPEDFTEFVQAFNVHLIETQRLLTFEHWPRGRMRGPVQQNTALRYAKDLTRRIREALAENSQTSQHLDRTFPRRVLEMRLPDNVTDQDIRERYEEQSALRNRLGEIAVLDTYPSLPLPDRELEDWERLVLWTYLEDTDEKLATFSHLLDRVGLLRRIVNSRFLFNQVRIDREAGFRFETASGQDVGPESLSSGEQHELVLIYDLLFNVEPETTVLIDEPEISLHVSWQQRFLDDIVEISRLASLRFIIATHSPQVIHKWWERAVALHSEDDRASEGEGERPPA